MYGIEVRESGAGMLVELWGEFDLLGVTFLDLDSARELALRSQLYAHYLTLHDPSPQVTASVTAFGLWGWIHFHPDDAHEEPPVFSEASS